jgi:hypothetical protein
MKTKEEFKEFFLSLEDDIIELEAIRKKRFWWQLGLLGGVLLFSTILLGVAYSYESYLGWILAIILIIAAIVGGGYGTYKLSQRHDLLLQYKEKVIAPMVSFMDDNLSYEPEKSVEYDHFRESRIFLQRPDYYHGDDYISGMFGDFQVEFSEIKVAYEQFKQLGQRARANWKTIFHGIFVVAQLPAETETPIIILSNRYKKHFGLLGQSIHQHNFRRNLRYVRMNDRLFTQEFAVYAQKTAPARLFLNETFKRKLLRLRNKAGNDVHLSIRGDKLYIAMKLDRNFFDVNPYLSFLSYRRAWRHYYDMVLILEVLDALREEVE